MCLGCCILLGHRKENVLQIFRGIPGVGDHRDHHHVPAVTCGTHLDASHDADIMSLGITPIDVDREAADVHGAHLRFAVTPLRVRTDDPHRET